MLFPRRSRSTYDADSIAWPIRNLPLRVRRERQVYPWYQGRGHGRKPPNHQHGRGLSPGHGGARRRRPPRHGVQELLGGRRHPQGEAQLGYRGHAPDFNSRFQRAESIRYNMRYMGIRRERNRAYVDVLIDANYTIATANGPQRQEMRDQNELVLEFDGRRWLFVSGM